MTQPRGFSGILGAILTEPTHPEADYGVIFTYSGGYFNSCGDSTFSVAKVLIEQGMVEVKEPKGWIAIDVNEDNITAVSSDDEVKRYDLSRLKKAGYSCFWRKREIQQKYARDRRILRKALAKLSRNYHNLVKSKLHKFSASLTK